MAKGWNERMDIPWDNVHTGSEPVDPGIYALTVKGAVAQPTKKSGRPSISVELGIFQKYDSDEELDKKVFDTFTVTPEGAFKMKQFAEVADLELPETNGYDEVCDFAEAMMGIEIWANVVHHEFDKRVRNRVDRYLTDEELEQAASKSKESEGSPAKRTIRRGKSTNGAKDTEEIKDNDDDDQKKEQKPQKARMGKRRRAQT